jgi:hypothetical protein
MKNLPACDDEKTLELLLLFDNGIKVKAAEQLQNIIKSQGWGNEWTLVACYNRIHDLHTKMYTSKKEIL